MLCPICNLDLTPLDPTSRTEHVNICIEGGPTTSLAFERNGHLIGARHNEPSKQRIICPVCSKTFQQVYNHFKLCAFKNDIPPHLLTEYWDKINAQLTSNKETTKPFPREILDNFILKCMKEGRMGADVEYAQALSMSLAESDTKKTRKRSQNNAWSIELQHLHQTQANTQSAPVILDESSMQSTGGDVVNDESTPMVTDPISLQESSIDPSDPNPKLVQSEPILPQASMILKPSNCIVNMMRNETKKQMLNQTTQILTDTQASILLPQGNTTMLTLSHLKQAGTSITNPKKKRRLELISDEDKCDAIQLRVDRELAASKYWRRHKTYRVIEGDIELIDVKLPNLWCKSRLSLCDITSCRSEDCDHEKLIFVLDEFRIYSSSLDKRQRTTAADRDTEEFTAEDANECETEVVNDFTSLSDNLLGLVNKQWMADLIIKSGYTNFYAHKLIWFTRTFKNNRPTMTLDGIPTIDMSDFSTTVIKHLLNFIYGSILPTLDGDILEDLKSLASRLGCQNLVDMINSSMRQKNNDLSRGSQNISNLKVLSCPPVSNS